MTPAQEQLFTTLFEIVQAVVEITETRHDPMLGLRLRGDAAAAILLAWARVRCLDVRRDEIRPTRPATTPWTRLTVLLGTSSVIEVYPDHRSPSSLS